MRATATRADRIKGAIGAGLLQAALLYALLHGLGVTAPHAATETLKLFDVAPDPPPPERPIAPHARSHRREGAASPPNLRAKATEIVAPPPVIALTIPPPVAAAPIAGVGATPSSGAADVRGPGTGAGGIGNGTGSGGRGDGDGAGETPPRKLKGRIRNSDFPGSAADAGASGTATVRYTVHRLSHPGIKRQRGPR
jgi:protein TonB